MIEVIIIEMKLDGQCEENSLHSYNIARIRQNGTVLVCILTFCNTRTDALTFPQPVDNPLASLARVVRNTL